jgi:hypothetical protein
VFRVLRSAVYPVQWMGLIMMHYGMAAKRMGGNVKSECEEDDDTDTEDGDSDADW